MSMASASIHTEVEEDIEDVGPQLITKLEVNILQLKCKSCTLKFCREME